MKKKRFEQGACRKILLSVTEMVAFISILGLLTYSSIGFADEKSRIEDLEQKLDKNLKVMESLQKEIQNLKSSSERSSRGTPVSQDVRLIVIEQSERLEDLEDIVQDIDERVGSRALVRAFDARSLDLGGFFHQTSTYVGGEDVSTHAFNRGIFEILVKARFDKHWTAFFAQAFIRQSGNPFAVGSRKAPQFNVGGGTVTPTVIAWANYKYSDALNVQIGRYITPQGIINVEHFPATLLDPEQPQFLRPFGSDTMFANFTTGFQIHGRQFVGDNLADKLSYNVYVGSFVNDSENFVYGARGAYSLGNTGVTLGVNYNGGERATGVGKRFNGGGLDVLVDKGKLLWKTEVFVTDEDSNTRDNRFAWYTQPAWRLTDKWIAFYRYDFLDNGLREGDRIENVLGINYMPNSSVRLRAIYTRKEFDSGVTQPSADADIFQLSGTFSF